MKHHLLAFALTGGLCATIAAPARAQLAAPNASGVAVGHVHINAKDLDAQVRFWTAVGGTIVQREKLTMVRFPGIYVLLRQQQPSAGSVGSTVNHFGFYVRDLSRVQFPVKHVLHDLVRAGELPYWNRFVSAGQPIAANPVYSVFYPPAQTSRPVDPLPRARS